jgi:hypothetical protein
LRRRHSHWLVILLLDEKGLLEACNVILERQIKELKEMISELEAALQKETKATITAPKEEGDSEVAAQRHASCQKVQVVAAAAPGGQD